MISISQKLNQSFDKKGQTDGNKYSADYNNVELNLVKPRSLWAMGGWVCCSQIINNSLQPRATEIFAEHSFASHNGRETDWNWLVW